MSRSTREEPEACFVPPRLVVTPETGAWLLDQLENPPAPTDGMRALFAPGNRPETEPDVRRDP